MFAGAACSAGSGGRTGPSPTGPSAAETPAASASCTLSALQVGPEGFAPYGLARAGPVWFSAFGQVSPGTQATLAASRQPYDGWKVVIHPDPSASGTAVLTGLQCGSDKSVRFCYVSCDWSHRLESGASLKVDLDRHLDYTGYMVFPGPGLMRLTASTTDSVLGSVVIEVPMIPDVTYPPTGLPAGAVDYEGIWLVGTDGEAAAVCRASARQLGFKVPCPSVLPWGATLCSTVCSNGGRFFMRSQFPAPADYVGQDGVFGLGTLAIEGYLTNSRTIDCMKISNQAAFHDYARGVVEYIAQCSDGAAAWWSEGAYTYAVKVSGLDSRNRGLAKYVVHSLELIAPIDS